MIRSRALAIGLVVVGGLSVATGVALFSVAAGVVVLGVLLVAAGLLLVDV